MTATQTTTSTWTIDPVHTIVGYEVRHMGISTFKGRFRTVTGAVTLDEANPPNSVVTAEIDAASIDLPEGRFYSRIVDPDFLNAQEHPKITFRSTRVERMDGTHWKVHGGLAIRGVTKDVTLDTEYLGQDKHPFSGKMIAAFNASTTIDRRDFGITWNAPLESGGVYLGERLRITLAIEAIRQE